jgi:hypothetical protein
MLQRGSRRQCIWILLRRPSARERVLRRIIGGGTPAGGPTRRDAPDKPAEITVPDEAA